MRRACIDIGSNTTRLLVADCAGGGLVECAQERVFTHIGTCLSDHGEIPPAKIEEVAAAVAGQLATAHELGAEWIRCVATAGVRRAANAGALVERVAAACDGLELEILSGAEEARLAFIGAAWGAQAGAEDIGVVDAGGGSSELVVGRAPGEVAWWISLPLGSGDVTARWLHSDPAAPDELELARQHVHALFSRAEPPTVPRVIAVGGSATTLRLLGGPLLTAERFGELFAIVQRSGSAKLATRFGIDVQRARLLAGGLLLLESVSQLFGAPLEVGRGGLREGLLLEP